MKTRVISPTYNYPGYVSVRFDSFWRLTAIAQNWSVYLNMPRTNPIGAYIRTDESMLTLISLIPFIGFWNVKCMTKGRVLYMHEKKHVRATTGPHYPQFVTNTHFMFDMDSIELSSPNQMLVS